MSLSLHCSFLFTASPQQSQHLSLITRELAFSAVNAVYSLHLSNSLR